MPWLLGGLVNPSRLASYRHLVQYGGHTLQRGIECITARGSDRGTAPATAHFGSTGLDGTKNKGEKRTKSKQSIHNDFYQGKKVRLMHDS